MRVSEWILTVYYAYTTVLAFVLPVTAEIRLRVILVNLALFVVYAFVIESQRRTPGAWHDIVRDWMPVPLMLLAYKQMGWFAPPSHDFHLEKSWIAIDRTVLNDWGLKRAIESMGWVVPGLLEVCYLLVYTVPFFTLAMVYVFRRREESDKLVTVYLLGLFLAYAQFPYWPSEPPRTVFAGEDLPAITTFVRRFSLAVVGSYGIHTSVFPSAHVSGAFAAALAMRHVLADKPWVWRGLLIYAILIALATIYGRYHYVVDALAGFAVGVLALPLGRWLLRLKYHSEPLP